MLELLVRLSLQYVSESIGTHDLSQNKLSDLSKGTYIHDVLKKRWWGGGFLKIVTCLQILLFLNNKSIVHFLKMVGVERVKKLVILADVINR